MPGDNPLVSVLMTAYNRQNFIREAIESVLASTYSNFELIVVDDASTDKTLAIAKSYADKDERVKVYVNEKNLGDYPNRNKAASYSSGKYLKYLDSDDMILKDGLMKMVEAIECYPEAAMAMMWVYNDAVFQPVLYTPEMALKEYFFNNKWLLVGPTGSIYNSTIFFKMGGFSGKQYVGDFEFNMRCATLYPIVKMQNGLIYYRIHDQQQGLETGHSKTFRVWQYKIQHEVLMNSLCPLKEADRKVAFKKINKLQARRVVFYFFNKMNLIDCYKIIKESGLGWKNFIVGLLTIK
jgi:glycosyltransferase involved in cell wall biosynthesis